MNVAEAETLLKELASLAAGWKTEVGMRGQPPHDYAYLKISSPTDPSDFAIVSTPGDGWFELEVKGGYYSGETGDLLSYADVREILEKNVSRALHYLDGEWTAEKTWLFRTPYINLRTAERHVKLTLSVSQTLKRIFAR